MASKKDAALAEENKRETLMRVTEGALRGIVAWSSDGFVDDFRERLSDREFRQNVISRLRANPADIKAIKPGAKHLAAMMTLLLQLRGREDKIQAKLDKAAAAPKRDRKDYMREFMRRKRAEKRK